MDNHFKEALELVKCQAAVRIMTAEEMTAMAQRLCRGLKALSEGEAVAAAEPAIDPSKAIKEKTALFVWNAAKHSRLLPKNIWPNTA